MQNRMMILNSSDSDSSSESSDDGLFDYLLRRRRPKVTKPRNDHFANLNDEEFFERFRFTKQTTNHILEYIEDDIKYRSQRNFFLSPMQQLLLTLRFYASGNMLIAVGDFLGVKKSTASRTIRRVSEAIAALSHQFIKFPGSEADLRNSNAGFFRISRFPKVIGTIDCTHIKIQSPGNIDGEVYRNRKGYFSYNVQTVSNFDLKITNIVARWPGSAHDQTIFNNSRLKIKIESPQYKGYYLLGDSGYRNSNYLLTPLLNPNDAAQQRYNSCHIRTRNTVERQYGLWKRRFPILALGLRLSPDLVKIVIVATAVLHNIAIDAREPLPVQDIPEIPEVHNEDNRGIENNNARQH